MSEYVITINSTSDLPKEWVWERKIPVVPLNCTIGGNTYRDMYDLSADEFYGMSMPKNLKNISNLSLKQEKISCISHFHLEFQE